MAGEITLLLHQKGVEHTQSDCRGNQTESERALVLDLNIQCQFGIHSIRTISGLMEHLLLPGIQFTVIL